MFQQGKFFRHSSSLDLDIYIVDKPIRKKDGVILKIKYYNRHMKTFQPDASTVDNILIKKSSLKNWKESDT